MEEKLKDLKGPIMIGSIIGNNEQGRGLLEVVDGDGKLHWIKVKRR
jgi:hypothetical protein